MILLSDIKSEDINVYAHFSESSDLINNQDLVNKCKVIIRRNFFVSPNEKAIQDYCIHYTKSCQ